MGQMFENTPFFVHMHSKLAKSDFVTYIFVDKNQDGYEKRKSKNLLSFFNINFKEQFV
jgi:hypothetical protein